MDLSLAERGTHQGLPNNPDAEANVLSAMLLSSEVVEEALTELLPDDFYRPMNKSLFETMHDMYDRSMPIDSITLIDYLNSENKLQEVGGEAYILELMGQTLSLVNWQHHASIVRRDAMLREIIGATNQINQLAYNAPTDTKEVVERAESMLLSVTDREVKNAYKPLNDFLIEAFNEAKEVCEAGGVAAGVPTGYPSLDRMLMGLREGQLVIIGARPAVGKTSFALNLALNAASEGYTVAFFSLEMSGKEIAQRFICAHAQVSMSNFRTGKISPQEWANIGQAAEDLSRLDILIDDTPGITVTEIRAKARRMLHNKEKAIIILDYLQLVSPPAGRRAESRTVEVSEMSRALKIMAKELAVPVISLSQLSRAVESRTGKRPQLSDLRESGSIEQDADIVMFLDRSSNEQEAGREDRPPEGITRIIVAKNRSGPIGDVDLVFLAASTKFYELNEHAEE
ncbi:replicative DNA helicase [Collinsella bouchesdurhonensis]|uniref:replicative DNA helicase n=1 Tax=Collinsella bouchesdurhonensis TaxID=1907654 RepID=UPI00096A7DE7|nr:replicative DNA helicase [Collinsella bouchesdurhonensis]MCI5784973.1 replicative DNA helicase [Collinsella bouchesdurhonensis]MDY3053550.1 replicative DNA helicase [Collinsella bouchesdurhonensis]